MVAVNFISMMVLEGEGPVWILWEKWTVHRILKKIAIAGGPFWIANHSDAAKVRALAPRKAFEDALASWTQETARLASEGEKGLWLQRQTSKVRLYVKHTYTFAYTAGFKVPAHSGTEELELAGLVTEVITKVRGRRLPKVSREGYNRILAAIMGAEAEPRLLIPFLGRGEFGLTLDEQFLRFGGLDPSGLLPEIPPVTVSPVQRMQALIQWTRRFLTRH